jgi:hypothetical protein
MWNNTSKIINQAKYHLKNFERLLHHEVEFEEVIVVESFETSNIE